MKKNLPVTNNEVVLKKGCAIISYTDSKGMIKYVNHDFLEVSGFSEAECLGKSHNMIRHPDMPPEAFRDLWHTIKQGRPWQGFVKNRCKNGDYYWVKATVTPRDDGTYMSVRVPASREEIQHADALYQEMNRKNHVTLHEGMIVPKGLLGKLSKVKNWFKNKGMLTYSLVVPLIILTTGLSFFYIEAMSLFKKHDIQNELSTFMWLSLPLVLALFISMLFIVLNIKVQSNKLKLIEKITANISKGNLLVDVPVGQKNDIGNIFSSLQIMRNRLFEIAFQMRQNSVKLNAKSSEMVNSSSALSASSNQEAQASESMSAALEELTASIEEIGENAKNVYVIAEETGNASMEGAVSVNKNVNKMLEIADRINKSAQSVDELNQYSSKIGHIVSSIESIAEQTNLLALNAAIEAARAGEHGRGFAVVADEVRNLARRTAESTKEISDIVNAIQKSTETAVFTMKSGVNEVNEGVLIAQTAGETVSNIQRKTDQVIDSVNSIQQVLNEQALAAREVARTIEEISITSKENAQSAELSLDISNELVSIAGVMKQVSDEMDTENQVRL